MKIVSASFVTSASGRNGYPGGELPDVAFAGRSNVGKSSLINMLVNRKSLARTSKSPGRTQLINFFLVNDKFYLVDLPGYGFAKVPEKVRIKWGKMIEEYLSQRENLRGVVMLVDSRHDPTRLDHQMYQWLCHYKIATVIVVTKIDKLSKNQANRQLARIKKELGVLPEHPLVATSAKTRAGRKELLEEIYNLLQ
ncbi:MAG: YihA family ribosome biogenesis GTP-binding protein [Desulfotomaculum sp.]|nr:YihA family ribosome biogenesis GTP-binding protein [Desulfotomaculum sp.]